MDDYTYRLSIIDYRQNELFHKMVHELLERRMQSSTNQVDARKINQKDRIIAHFDLDAFYVACERELNPFLLLHQPVAVSQYNPHGTLTETHSSQVDQRIVAKPPHDANSRKADGNGSMIAVSYEARAAGVQRGDRGRDAIQKCPHLYIVQVPVKRGKADLTMYRNASTRIMDVLVSNLLSGIGEGGIGPFQRSDIKVEKASIDEIYIDLTIPCTLMMEQIHNNATAKDDSPRSENIWRHVMNYGSDIGCTTVGGIETMSKATLAANGLSKDQLRKGSKLQMLEQAENGCGAWKNSTVLDEGSQTWWNRPIPEWTTTEVCLACGTALAAKARGAVRAHFRIPNEAKVDTTDPAVGGGGGTDNNIFTLSGGISTNKTLAKLASGLKKPNRQTLINPMDQYALITLFHPLPIARLRGLGGKFGTHIGQVLDVKTVRDLSNVPLTILESTFPPSPEDDGVSTAQFLFDIARGICIEDVSERTVDKSMSSGKTFRGPLAFPASKEELVRRWITDLCEGLIERLEVEEHDNCRSPTLMVLSTKLKHVKAHSISRSSRAPKHFRDYVPVALKLFQQMTSARKSDLVFGLTVSATNFMDIATGYSSIEGAFGRTKKSQSQDDVKVKQLHPFKKSGKRPLPSFRSKSKILNTLDKSFAESIVKRNSEGEEETVVLADNSEHAPRSKSEEFSFDTIDKDVFSQLPQSIQSEIRSSSVSQTLNSTEKKDSIENWFIKRNEEKPQNTPSTKKLKSCSKYGKNDNPVNYLSEEVDPSVVAELPFDIQAMIRRDLRQQQKDQRQIKKLDSFFAKG
jgi:nucleotidyltransferase/DNA polymerase involved in DNA repair